MTTNPFVDSLIKSGMRLERSKDGDTTTLRLIPGKDLLDGRAVFEKRAGDEWFCIVPGYCAIAMAASAFQLATECAPQEILDAVVWCLERIPTP